MEKGQMSEHRTINIEGRNEEANFSGSAVSLKLHFDDTCSQKLILSPAV
jgi:hypothetical protein